MRARIGAMQQVAPVGINARTCAIRRAAHGELALHTRADGVGMIAVHVRDDVGLGIDQLRLRRRRRRSRAGGLPDLTMRPKPPMK